MTPRQTQKMAQLINTGYRPAMTGNLTNGCVCVAVARKLDVGVLHLLITPDGDLFPEYSVLRPRTITR